ncbi:MAG: hypothetical protein JNM38_20660 [Acidobacteria bacterium]|nr:hypothetical protein [Acidobacteriota bacterium]
MLAVAAVIGILRVWATAGVSPLVLSDSGLFTGLTTAHVLDGTLLQWPRAPIVPLLAWAIGGVESRVVALQVIVGAVAWALLAVVVIASMRTARGRLVAGVVVAGVAVLDRIAQWDAVLLAESVSFSCLALVVAALLGLLQRWTWPRAALTFAAAAAWSFTRDLDTFAVTALAGMALAWAVWSHSWRRWLPLAAGVLVVALTAQHLSARAVRWQFPFLNVLAQRILPEPVRTSFFASRGMPVSDRLMRLSGQWAGSEELAFYRDPALAGFREWLARDGRRTYVAFLLAYPGYLLSEPRREWATIVAPTVIDYRPRGYVPPFGERFAQLIVPAGQTVTPWLALVLAGVATVYRRLVNRPVAVAGAALVVAAVATGLAAWHADAMEIRRHALPASMMGHLGLWLIVVALADAEPPHDTAAPVQPGVPV